MRCSEFPVHQVIEEDLDVVWSQVLVVKVVSMFPDILNHIKALKFSLEKNPKSILTTVRRGFLESSVIGVSALEVFSMTKRPSTKTNQAQAEPKAVLAAFSNSLRKFSYEPKLELIKSRRRPVGAPPPFGLILFQ